MVKRRCGFMADAHDESLEPDEGVLAEDGSRQVLSRMDERTARSLSHLPAILLGGQSCRNQPISSTSSRSMWAPSISSFIAGWAIVRTRRTSPPRSSSRHPVTWIPRAQRDAFEAGSSPWHARRLPITGGGIIAWENVADSHYANDSGSPASMNSYNKAAESQYDVACYRSTH